MIVIDFSPVSAALCVLFIYFVNILSILVSIYSIKKPKPFSCGSVLITDQNNNILVGFVWDRENGGWEMVDWYTGLIDVLSHIAEIRVWCLWFVHRKRITIDSRVCVDPIKYLGCPTFWSV